MKNYEEMLDELLKKLPESAKEKARFKMPEFESFIQGSQTIIQNFVDVANTLRRDDKHLLKFLNKELASVGNIDGKRMIIKGKFRDLKLNEKLNKYAREYVLCRECGKPDTKLISEGNVTFIRCEACGARRPVNVIK